jgi:hypothetical protein
MEFRSVDPTITQFISQLDLSVKNFNRSTKVRQSVSKRLIRSPGRLHGRDKVSEAIKSILRGISCSPTWTTTYDDTCHSMSKAKGRQSGDCSSLESARSRMKKPFYIPKGKPNGPRSAALFHPRCRCRCRNGSQWSLLILNLDENYCRNYRPPCITSIYAREAAI